MGPSHFATCSLCRKGSTMPQSTTLFCGQLYRLILYSSTTFGDDQSSKPTISPSSVSSLVWTNLSSVVVHNIVTLLPAELPSLQHISLHGFHYHMDESKFPNCPLLESVELFDCSLHAPTPWVETFAHVTTLSITSISSPSARPLCPRGIS